MTRFLSDIAISATSWQAFERLVSRLLIAEGMEYVSVIGTSGDGGADVLAIRGGRRWLFQVKRWTAPVGPEVIGRTVAAARSYEADVPVIVSKSGFTSDARSQRSRRAAEGINIQLWDRDALVRRAARLPEEPLVLREPERFGARSYQEAAVQKIVGAWTLNRGGNALVVLATGLGKTFVAAEAARRIGEMKKPMRLLVIAHTNDLVYQLERSFWRFLSPDQATVVVNGVERPDWVDLVHFPAVFASRDTLASAESAGVELPAFDVVIVDECHHLGADTYERVLDGLRVGDAGWTLPPGAHGHSLAAKRRGFGAQIRRPGCEHRSGPRPAERLSRQRRLPHVHRQRRLGCVARFARRQFTPKAINRTLFINQWDDGVVERTQEAWAELAGEGRGIVFCGTIEHAEKMATRINALGFTNARPIYSKSSAGQVMGPIERNRLLWDFADGRIGILCAVDVLNEGVDVPDVNLVVFQRVTHSRRIFVQQLGRGLRLAPGKQRVIVLDFVSDVRRFAAGLELQRALDQGGPAPGSPVRVNLLSSVTFRRANGEDTNGAGFLREWLGDLEEVEGAGEDVSVLRFPPIDHLPGAERRT